MITAGESSTVNLMDEPNSFIFFVSMEEDRALKMEESELITLGVSVVCG